MSRVKIFQKDYQIDVEEHFFEQIKSGIKKVEVRINKTKFIKIQVGDYILLNKKIILEITSRTNYKSFRDMLLSEGLKNVIPEAEDLDQALSLYYKFYTKSQEKVFGVVAFGIKIVSK